jgi:hypothetical protein
MERDFGMWKMLSQCWRVQEYDGPEMKPAPAPNVPGNTEAERMSNALRMVLTVSKTDLLKKEARLKRASEKKRAAKKSN